MEATQGGAFLRLQDQWNSLSDGLNQAAKDAENQAPDPELTVLIDALSNDARLHQDEFNVVKALGELRSYQDVHIKA